MVVFNYKVIIIIIVNDDVTIWRVYHATGYDNVSSR